MIQHHIEDSGMHATRIRRFPRGELIGCFLLLLMLTQANSAAWSATQTELVRSCESCHGPHGDSAVATTPRLNGQQTGYIVDRLKKLAKITKSNPHARIGMFNELARKDDAAIVSIANYFSSQAPSSPRPRADVSEGKKIYEHGSPAENVIGCSQCHGAQGEGHNATPRLAGQHADYLRAQLRLFNLKFREHVLMNPNTKTMKQETMDALISYLANE